MALVTERKRYGKTVCRVTTYNPSKPWMKHGTETRVVDRELEAVNALAHGKSHVWGVLRRRGSTLAIVG